VSVRFSTEALAPLVPTIVTGLMNWAADSKNRFRQRIRVILERLIRRVGYDAIAAHVPASDAKLMAHIAKMKSRKERNRDRKKNGEASLEVSGEPQRTQSGRQWHGKEGATYQELLMDSDEEADEEGDAHEDSGMLLRDDGDAPINLLDTKSAMHLVTGASALAVSRKSNKPLRQMMAIAKDGRMIVDMEEDVGMDLDDNDRSGTAKSTSIDDLQQSAAHEDSSSRPSKRRKGRGNEDLNGSRFKSTKAGGDVRRKGDKLLPFAYVQMGSNFLNQRKKRQNIHQFDQLTAGGGRKGGSGGKGKRKR
jgi:ribosomal RNA-processing protein 12